MRIGLLGSFSALAIGAVVQVPSASPRPVPARWSLTLERTIAPPFGSPGALAKPYDLAVLRDGRIAVLDRDATGVLLYGADGRFERAIGGRGHGPGEFSQFAKMDVRGDTIAVYDDATAIVWRASGAVVRQWRTEPCSCGRHPVLDGRGNLLVPAGLTVAGTRRDAMVRWTLTGVSADTVLLPVLGAERAWLKLADGSMVHLPFGSMRIGAFDTRLRYIHGIGTEYSLVIAAHGTDTLQVVRLPGDRPTIPAALRDSAYASLMKNPAVAQVLKLSDLETRQPAFLNIASDERDNIWIERPTGRGTIDHFDVMAPDGSLIAVVPAPTEQPTKFTPVVFRYDRIYWLSENANGEPVIQVFRIAH